MCHLRCFSPLISPLCLPRIQRAILKGQHRDILTQSITICVYMYKNVTAFHDYLSVFVIKVFVMKVSSFQVLS